MSNHIPRREFLKTVPAAATVIAYAGAQTSRPENVRIGTTSFTPVPDYPIRPKPGADVRIRDSFWKPKITTNARVTIPLEIQKMTQAERNFSNNVLEAAILTLKDSPDPVLEAQVERQIRSMAGQTPRGNSSFEVAATLYHTTGRRDLLDPAVKSAAALYDNFKQQNPPFSGGERDAINCVQLYRATHDKRHLELAKHYLDIRGLENSVNRSRHNQSYKPVLEQSEAVGHAVNCVSLMVSLTDVGVLTGIKDYFNAAQRMWTDIVERKLYVTGGVGSTGNEGFGEPYVLPNISAYAETCAVLMFITLNHRLFLATGDSKYIDAMERGMYNNALSGVSTTGDRFFYVNRLASAGDGRDARWERAALECCPPNLVRFLAAMPGLVYAQDRRDAIYVNLYLSSDATFTAGGKDLALSIDSEMPWEGKSRIRVSAKQEAGAAIKMRIPGWTRNQPTPGALYSYVNRLEQQTRISVNGKTVNAVPDRQGYVSIERIWKDGDTVDVEFPVEVRRVVADARIRENRGRFTVERGPIVFCTEFADAEDKRALDRIADAVSEMKASFDSTLLGGATVIRSSSPQPVTLVPYHLWANRGVGEMSVWLRTREYEPGDVGPSGGLICYKNPNPSSDWRYLEAAPVDQSIGARWGCFRRAVTGARGTAVGTGKQNTADILAACGDRGTAADLCGNYNLNGVGGWFLPSRDELSLMYRHLKASGLGEFRTQGMNDNAEYWTSSQVSADMAHHIDFADNGRDHYDDKDFPRRVRAIRSF